jgi:DNA-binding response OmpR family regulator
MKTIMVVDEEINVLEKVKTFLEEDKFEVVTAENNRKALKLISEDSEDKYGLILINTMLPESNTPAFFSMKPKSKMNIDTSKKEDFLQKPFTKEELLNFIKKKIN